MAKPELGLKRVCPSCASRFYDLTKRPIVCPKCAFSFEPEMLVKQRRTRVPEPAVVKQEVPAADVEADDTDEERDEETAEAEDEEEAAEPTIEEAPLVAGTDGDEEEEEEAEPTATGISVSEGAPDEAEDFEDADVEGDEEEDDGLLEEVGEDEDDVSGIIDTDIPTKEEP